MFGLDFYREGMLFAMMQRPPAFGTKIKSVDDCSGQSNARHNGCGNF